MIACSGKGFPGDVITGQLAVANCFVNPCQVLINDSPRAEVQMADLGIAHLPFWQTNVAPTRTQFTARILAIEPIVKGGAREQGCVSVLLALFQPVGVDAPAVTDDEHHRAGHMRALWRRSTMPTSPFRSVRD